MARYHVDPQGNTKPCSATVKDCPYQHGATPEEARQVYEASMAEALVPKRLSKQEGPGFQGEYSATSYYGNKPPRPVQLEALNAVQQALEEEEATQLVAACGTGKTYMSRQLLNHFMSKEDSTGVGVVLTSSIKLAQDTAADLRPPAYDHAFGEFGKDYEVVEVHSGAKRWREGAQERQSVVANGVVSEERIRAQIAAAQAAGKKVVIVSTYDSVGKVVAAQAALGEAAEADLLLHDEAHNILGQQKPTTLASEENQLTAYTGFHNSIPGALQARRRLYATATPVVRELPEDKENVESLEEAREIAARMAAGAQELRVTVYSDDPLVGRVSGFISQEEAVESGCLAKAEYQVREAVLQGDSNNYAKPSVTPDGSLLEEEVNPMEHPLTPQTYGALSTTIDALVADPEEGVNPPTNVLAYVGSIDQAEAYKEAFREAALAKAGGMGLKRARELQNSPKEEERLQARARLLAEYAEVKAAHSRTDSASVREKAEAFKMFSGHSVQEGPWTPHKRVLANVDIFSEGVSISEIDTVVLSDDDKSNERSLTQAVGRAQRVVPGNSYKTTGHVLVPSVKDGKGRHLNEASVELAAYATSKMQRGTVATRLRGGRVAPDTTTTFTVHEGGSKRRKLATAFSQETVSDVPELAAGAQSLTAHSYLLRTDPTYRASSPQEQHEMVLTRLREQRERAANLKNKSDAAATVAALDRTLTVLEGRNYREVKELQRKGKVVAQVLATGDVASLPPALTDKLIRAEVLKPREAKAELTVAEKRQAVEAYGDELAYAVYTSPPSMTEEHRRVQERLGLPQLSPKEKAALGNAAMARARGMAVKEPKTLEVLDKVFKERLAQDDEFAAGVFELATKGREAVPILGGMKRGRELQETLSALAEERHQRDVAHAQAGEAAYDVDPSFIRKTGELTSKTLQKMLQLDAWNSI